MCMPRLVPNFFFAKQTVIIILSNTGRPDGRGWSRSAAPRVLGGRITGDRRGLGLRVERLRRSVEEHAALEGFDGERCWDVVAQLCD